MQLPTQTIELVCMKFNIVAEKISDVIDTSRNEEDIRLIYVINDTWVLKMNTASVITEEFLLNLHDLSQRYRSIDVWCPDLRKTVEDTYLCHVFCNMRWFFCYMEEFAPYKTLDSYMERNGLTDEFQQKKKYLGHLGRLAAQYTNVNLVETRSMWSIIDLAPLDVDVDEKQENLNTLTECLNNCGYQETADVLIRANEQARNVIKKHFDELPRCVYQGDLNTSNILVDEQGEFKGIIDFNMFGTEVNINCFLNETAFLQEEDFEGFSAAEIKNQMRRKQKELLDVILAHYAWNEAEKVCFSAYQKIIDISQFPNVMLWKYLLENHRQEEKVIELLQLLAE